MTSAKGTSQGKSPHFQGCSSLGSRMVQVKGGPKVKWDPLVLLKVFKKSLRAGSGYSKNLCLFRSL